MAKGTEQERELVNGYFKPIKKHKLVKVKAVQDNEGNWYIIPNKLMDEFEKDLDSFDCEDKYDEYLTNSTDLNKRQLYAREIE